MKLKHSERRIIAVIPAFNEIDYIFDTLECIKKQTYKNYSVYICVNQPDYYWELPDKIHICINNSKTIELIRKFYPTFNIIDKTSKNLGWAKGKEGVGYARKLLMDTVSSFSNDNDIIVSLDADTSFNENYFEAIINIFNSSSDIIALSVPYYHKLTNDEKIDRAILRYEFYLRNYALNLWRIGCPASFTAMGSAIALPVKSYKKVRGIDPKQSGEDFYFLLKLSKAGYVACWCQETVYPSPRKSDRVIFGTGPAVSHIIDNKTDNYPIYHYKHFDVIKDFYNNIPLIYQSINYNNDNEFCLFLYKHFKNPNIFEPLKKNYPSLEKFTKAVHTKANRLRILQFIKSKHNATNHYKDENVLLDMLEKFYYLSANNILDKNLNLDFQTTDIKYLNKIRNYMYELEIEMAKSDYENKTK